MSEKFASCAACHKTWAGANNVGPSLHGIFTRKAGELSISASSPAAQLPSSITRPPETLDKFISDPQAVVPANRMPYAGIANAGDRADLIAYLSISNRHRGAQFLRSFTEGRRKSLICVGSCYSLKRTKITE